MAWQSIAGLRKSLDEDGAQELLDNLGTILTMRAANIHNAQDIAEQFTTYPMRLAQAGRANRTKAASRPRPPGGLSIRRWRSSIPIGC